MSNSERPLPHEVLTSDHLLDFISIICSVDLRLTGAKLNKDLVVNNSELGEMSLDQIRATYNQSRIKGAVENIFSLLVNMGLAYPVERGNYNLDESLRDWYRLANSNQPAAFQQMAEYMQRLWFAQLDLSSIEVFESQALQQLDNPDDVTRKQIGAAYHLLEAFGLMTSAGQAEAFVDEQVSFEGSHDSASDAFWTSDENHYESGAKQHIVELQTDIEEVINGNEHPAGQEFIEQTPAQSDVSVEEKIGDQQALDPSIEVSDDEDKTPVEPSRSISSRFAAQLLKRSQPAPSGDSTTASDESETIRQGPSKRSSISPFGQRNSQLPDTELNSDDGEAEKLTASPVQQPAPLLVPPTISPPQATPQQLGFGAGRRGAYDQNSNQSQSVASHLNRMQRAREQQANQPAPQPEEKDEQPNEGIRRRFSPTSPTHTDDLPVQPQQPSLDKFRRADPAQNQGAPAQRLRQQHDNRTYGPRGRPSQNVSSPQTSAAIILMLNDGTRVEITQEFLDNWKAEHQLSTEDALAALRDIFLQQKDERDE
jgi:hypothetical protein